jgi:iron complex outermembrane receptor protein
MEPMTHFAPLNRLSPVALAIAMLAPWSAHAQQSEPAQTGSGSGQAASAATSLERVEVTALKTRQSLQDVPASVTALTADDLARSGIVNSADLQQKVPGLSLSSGGRETNLSIRGVSNNVRSIGADPSNAVHLDGIYLPRSSMVLTELFDLQRVEVLKGPEGTLYGRNATGGAINVVTRAPTAKPGAEGFFDTGSLGLRRTQLAVGGGTDGVSGRLAVASSKDDGYTRNLSTGTGLDKNDFKAFRGKLRFALGDKGDLTLLAQASEDKGTIGYGVSTDPSITGPLYPYSVGDPDYKLTAANHRTDARNIRLDSPISSSRKTSVLGATVNWDLGSVGLKSITGFTSFKSGDQNDVDWTGAKLETQDTTTDVSSTSQEFQLYSQGDGPLEWTAGLFLYRDKGTETLDWLLHGPLNCGAPGSCAFARQTVKSSGRSEAVFGQMTYHFTPKWSGMLGARYSHDTKDGDATNRRTGANFIGDVSFSAFTPKAQLQWKPSKELMTYASVSKGFKSGGFNFGRAGIEKFEPESIVATEVGVRSTLMGGALSLNASAFNYDYKDLQLRTAVLDAVSGNFLVNVNNASKAKVQGLELSADAALGAGFRSGLTAAIIDSELQNYVSPSTRRDLSGMPLPLTPKTSGSAWLDHTTSVAAGQLRSRLEYNYRSSVVFPLTLDQANNKGEAYGLVNASLRWTAPRDAWYMQAGVLNATNKLYRTMRADYAFGGVVESFGAPRTFMLRMGFKY